VLFGELATRSAPSSAGGPRTETVLSEASSRLCGRLWRSRWSGTHSFSLSPACASFTCCRDDAERGEPLPSLGVRRYEPPSGDRHRQALNAKRVREPVGLRPGERHSDLVVSARSRLAALGFVMVLMNPLLLRRRALRPSPLTFSHRAGLGNIWVSGSIGPRLHGLFLRIPNHVLRRATYPLAWLCFDESSGSSPSYLSQIPRLSASAIRCGGATPKKYKNHNKMKLGMLINSLTTTTKKRQKTTAEESEQNPQTTITRISIADYQQTHTSRRLRGATTPNLGDNHYDGEEHQHIQHTRNKYSRQKNKTPRIHKIQRGDRKKNQQDTKKKTQVQQKKKKRRNIKARQTQKSTNGKTSRSTPATIMFTE